MKMLDAGYWMLDIRRCKHILLLFLTSSICFLTSSCGFQPMYGSAFDDQTSITSVETQLAQTEIVNIPEREGQALRNLLIDRFYRQGRPITPIYRLSIAPINESLIDLDITKTADATRGQLRLTTTMQLIDLETGQVLMGRPLRAITSYNILSSEFSTRVSEEDARQNALNDLARQIELQVNLYFKNNN